MSELEFILKLAEWAERETGIQQAKAADLLVKGDAGALFASGMAQAYMNAAVLLKQWRRPDGE